MTNYELVAMRCARKSWIREVGGQLFDQGLKPLAKRRGHLQTQNLPPLAGKAQAWLRYGPFCLKGLAIVQIQCVPHLILA